VNVLALLWVAADAAPAQSAIAAALAIRMGNFMVWSPVRAAAANGHARKL
jgi:hypothetical protein